MDQTCALRRWLLDEPDDDFVERADITESAWAVLEVLDEALFFCDGLQFFSPGFDVTKPCGDLDADLTGLGLGHGATSLG